MTNNNLSDWQAYYLLLEKRHSSNPSNSLFLNNDVIYKAAAALANSGEKLKEESVLPMDYRELLEARRDLFASNFEKVQKDLEKSYSNSLLEGDKNFLLGLSHYRSTSKNIKLVEDYLTKSVDCFASAGEEHRKTRALVNLEITTHNGEASVYLSGSIHTLLQEAIRKNYFDISSTIYRCRGIEYLLLSEWEKALSDFQESIQLGSKESSPVDLSVNYALCALANYALGRIIASKEKINGVHIKNKRTSYYLELYQCLNTNKLRKAALLEGPLKNVKWQNAPRFIGQEDSTYFKIISFLQSGPKTKSEIINQVWEGNHQGACYSNRFHVALTSLKKKHQYNIKFSGQKYYLAD